MDSKIYMLHLGLASFAQYYAKRFKNILPSNYEFFIPTAV